MSPEARAPIDHLIASDPDDGHPWCPRCGLDLDDDGFTLNSPCEGRAVVILGSVRWDFAA